METARDARDHSEGNVLFRPFSLPKPYTSTTDVFCQRERGIVNAYRCISRFGHVIIVPKAPLDEVVELNLIPSQAHQSLDIRVWHEDKMLQSTTRPLEGVRVHL